MLLEIQFPLFPELDEGTFAGQPYVWQLEVQLHHGTCIYNNSGKRAKSQFIVFLVTINLSCTEKLSAPGAQ